MIEHRMKQAGIFIVIVLLISVIALTGCGTENRTETITTSTSEPKTVIFPDENLDAIIRDTLGKPTGEEITIAELANLTVFSASSSDITDLSGIEYCANLIELDLSSNQISDIYPLSTLTNLMVLNLDTNRIIDISAISNLTNLSWLNIKNNDIGDIWPLAYNTGLGKGDRVFIAGNEILIVEHTGPWDVVTELLDRGVELHIQYNW